jgi:GNAT superfamily N-acetyltransferase
MPNDVSHSPAPMAGSTGLRIEAVASRHAVQDFLQQARAQMFAGRVDTTAIAPDLLDFEQVYGRNGRMLAAHDAVHGLVGTIAWRAYDGRFVQLDFTGRRVVEVVRLFVAPECRRQGIADALFAALKAQAMAQGMEVLYLHTHPFLPGAQAFWQRHGFQVLCRDADPEWQTIHMQCRL